MQDKKLTVSVHKFTSCDGCQLSFINLGETLLALSEVVEFVHFAELGPVAPDAKVDVAFIEGSITTPSELERIKKIRLRSQYLISIGACATSGGIQALRNMADTDAWVKEIYARPEYIKTLQTSTAISDHVIVDLSLWGCPVSSEQIVATLRALLRETLPQIRADSVCMECKRLGNVCVLVTGDAPCMGPVTHGGCGALCPSANRACYSCYGPSEKPNTESLANKLLRLGVSKESLQRQFLFINNNAPVFEKAAEMLKEKK